MAAASEALNEALRNPASGARPTLDYTLGFIFLSTPNTIRDGADETWLRYRLITDVFRKRVPEFAPRPPKGKGYELLDIALICAIAEDFKENIQTWGWPAVSVFDGKNTRTGGRLRAKSLHVSTENGLPVSSDPPPGPWCTPRLP